MGDPLTKGHTLKYFQNQDLELYYQQKALNPQVEKEIKDGFFEIKKKYEEGEDPSMDEK